MKWYLVRILNMILPRTKVSGKTFWGVCSTMSEKCAAMNGFRFVGGDCGDYPECDGCTSDARIVTMEEFELRGSLRAGK